MSAFVERDSGRQRNRKPVLLVRALYTPQSGSGHVFRVLALVECALREGWHVSVVTDSALADVPLQHECLQWRVLASAVESEADDARQSLSVCQRGWGTATLVLLDHYGLGLAWESVVAEEAAVAVIDDLCRQHHASVWLIDYFPNRRESDYRHCAARLLLGLTYLLLRSGFRSVNSTVARKTVEAEDFKILVQFGGAEVSDFAVPVLKALHDCAELKGSVCWLQGDVARLDFWHRQDLCIRSLPQCSDMPSLYNGHDVAIGASGVAMWERLAVGLPSFVWPVAENQQDNFQAARAFPMIRCASVSSVDAQRWLADFRVWSATLKTQKAAGIDALGANRVWQKICPDAFALSNRIQFEPYAQNQIESLFKLQQLPGVRTWSRNPEPPTWPQHRAWSEQLLASEPARGWLMMSPTQEAIGWLKLDAADSSGYREVSLLIHPEYQAMGLGKRMLRFAKAHSPRLSAFVDARNTASSRLFERCGFTQQNHWFFWQLNTQVDSHDDDD